MDRPTEKKGQVVDRPTEKKGHVVDVVAQTAEKIVEQAQEFVEEVPIKLPEFVEVPPLLASVAGETGLEWVTEEISKVYRKHNPDKLDDILQQIKTKYAGMEMTMYLKVCKKYGVTPSEFPGPEL